MASNQPFQPDWASSPGDTITDILTERNLSLGEFAQQMGQSLELATMLLQGRAAISLALARQLSHVLGASVEFWMSRDFQYREDAARLDAINEEWLTELPIGDMIRFGWLTPKPHPADKVAACLRFFDVPTIKVWRETYVDVEEMVSFRTSPAFDSRPGAVAAWLRRAEIEAEAVDCGPWDAQRFYESLLDIRALTWKKDPRRFVPELRKCCADNGVAVAVVRAPNGCRASGAAKFLSREKALLLLSFRYLTDDQFWFSFFHEAGHLLLHNNSRLFLEGLSTLETSEEQEANEFAARTLVPSEFQAALLDLPADGRKVIRFARRVGVSPGIIVGQLQHLGRIRYNQLNHLKRRYTWND